MPILHALRLVQRPDREPAPLLGSGAVGPGAGRKSSGTNIKTRPTRSAFCIFKPNLGRGRRPHSHPPTKNPMVRELGHPVPLCLHPVIA
jgi:hypothetical protein